MTRVRWSFREEFELRIKPQHLAEAKRIIRAPQSFLKHADRDPDGAINLSVERLTTYILAAAMNFPLVTASWTKAMALFVCWVFAKRPNLLKSDADVEFADQIDHLRKMLAGFSHEQQMFLLYRALQINYPELFAQAPPGFTDPLR